MIQCRQSVSTKYIGPTNSRESRCKATASGGASLTIIWDDALNTEDNHRAAAAALIRKLAWGNPEYWIAAGGPKDDGHVFVDASPLFEVAEVARAMVNDIRRATWSGNPWCKAPFLAMVKAIARLHGYHGDATAAPTTDAELAAFKSARG